MEITSSLNVFGMDYMKAVRLQRKKKAYHFREASFDDGTQVEKAGDLENKTNSMRRRLV